MKILMTLVIAGFSAVGFAEAVKTGETESFLDKVAQANMAEIEAGQLAENKGTSTVVKKFGAMMVEHHTAANDKVKSLARSKNVELPTAPAEEQVASFKALQAKVGARFDQEYVAEQVKAHEEAVALLKGQIASGEDPETKALAQELLPTVQNHLREAYRLAGKEEMATTIPK